MMHFLLQAYFLLDRKSQKKSARNFFARISFWLNFTVIYQVSGLDDIFCRVSVHTQNNGHTWKNPGLQNSEKTFRDDCKLSSRKAQV